MHNAYTVLERKHLKKMDYKQIDNKIFSMFFCCMMRMLHFTREFEGRMADPDDFCTMPDPNLKIVRFGILSYINFVATFSIEVILT
jgi:hypothetical protein